MLDWTIALPTFLAASVEWVEAFTIVLAVSLSIGWAAASGAAAAALGVLALMTIVTGGVLQLGAAVSWLQLVIGIFLLLFGVRWLAKAVARRAGLKALHDEEEEFEETRAELAKGDRHAAWIIAFKGVLLEGLEVWLIVVALSVHHGAWLSSAGAALAALVVVTAAGLAIRAPLKARARERAQVRGRRHDRLVRHLLDDRGAGWARRLAPRRLEFLVLVAFYGLGGLALSGLFRSRTSTVRAS